MDKMTSMIEMRKLQCKQLNECILDFSLIITTSKNEILNKECCEISRKLFSPFNFLN